MPDRPVDPPESQRIPIDAPVQLLWAIANAEACSAGHTAIEPLHLLIALLKILDDAFQKDAEEIGLPPEMTELSPAVVSECLSIMNLSESQLTSARRGLSRSLQKSPESTFRMLHRSDATREVFEAAAARSAAEGTSTTSLSGVAAEMLARLPPEAAPFFPGRDVMRAAPVGDEQPTSADTSGSMEPIEPKGVLPGDSGDLNPMPQLSDTPTLDELGRDLTSLARASRLGPVVGREREMKALARYLQRTLKPNTILIGDAGVGKTAVVEGLAQRAVAAGAPEVLRDLRIVQINVADLVSGTGYRGDLERRLQEIITEATANPHLVLFLDEIHLVMGAGATDRSPMDVANVLKPALARSDFRCIGATTTDEYERYIRGDAAFSRRFQVLRVEEPSPDETLRICEEWARRIERVQHVVVDPDAVRAAVALSYEILQGRSQPDKAVDLLENAAVFAMVSSLSSREVAPTKEAPRITREHIEGVLDEMYDVQRE